MKGYKRPYFSDKRVYNFWKLWAIFNKLNTQLETYLLKSLKCVAEEGGALLPKNWSPENTGSLEAQRGKKNIIKNIIKNFFFTYCSFLCIAAKCKERESLPTICQSFRRKAVCFTELNVLLKQPIRIICLFKQKLRGALAGKQERTRWGR